jgi:hypothetical protein
MRSARLPNDSWHRSIRRHLDQPRLPKQCVPPGSSGYGADTQRFPLGDRMACLEESPAPDADAHDGLARRNSGRGPVRPDETRYLSLTIYFDEVAHASIKNGSAPNARTYRRACAVLADVRMSDVGHPDNGFIRLWHPRRPGTQCRFRVCDGFALMVRADPLAADEGNPPISQQLIHDGFSDS